MTRVHNFTARSFEESSLFFSCIKLILIVRLRGPENPKAKVAFSQLRKDAAKLLAVAVT